MGTHLTFVTTFCDILSISFFQFFHNFMISKSHWNYILRIRHIISPFNHSLLVIFMNSEGKTYLFKFWSGLNSLVSLKCHRMRRFAFLVNFCKALTSGFSPREFGKIVFERELWSSEMDRITWLISKCWALLLEKNHHWAKFFWQIATILHYIATKNRGGATKLNFQWKSFPRYW